MNLPNAPVKNLMAVAPPANAASLNPDTMKEAIAEGEGDFSQLVETPPQSPENIDPQIAEDLADVSLEAVLTEELAVEDLPFDPAQLEEVAIETVSVDQIEEQVDAAVQTAHLELQRPATQAMEQMVRPAKAELNADLAALKAEAAQAKTDIPVDLKLAQKLQETLVRVSQTQSILAREPGLEPGALDAPRFENSITGKFVNAVQKASEMTGTISDLDVDQAMQVAIKGTVPSGQTSHMSFLPVANFHTITQAVHDLGQRIDAPSSTSELKGMSNATTVQTTQTIAGTNRIEIQLVPKSLGVIEITMQRTDAGMNVQIQTQTTEAERLLSSDRAALQEVMRSAGITVDEIKVVSNPNLTDNQTTNRSNQAEAQGFGANLADQSGDQNASNGSNNAGANQAFDEGSQPSLLGNETDQRDGIYL